MAAFDADPDSNAGPRAGVAVVEEGIS